MREFLKLAVLAGCLLGLVACSSGNGSGAGGYNDPYYHAWYDVYGNYCGTGYPTAGCNFFADGYKITSSEDPYYNSGSTLYYDYWTFTDSYGFYSSYTGYAWLSPSGILYDEWGNALNEQEDDGVSTDLIAQAAAKEKKASQVVGKVLAQKYALAEDKGIQISKTLQDWAKLGKSRARTDMDVADFAKRLFGVDPMKAKATLTQAALTRDMSPVDEMNIDVAAYWGTSPEVSKQILKSWYKQELAQYGVK